MSDSRTFRKYAQECRRLAKQMKPEHRPTLLEIAEAWERCAEEADSSTNKRERGRRKSEDGGETEELSDQTHPSCCSRGRSCNGAGPPPQRLRFAMPRAGRRRRGPPAPAPPLVARDDSRSLLRAG
jgi:hypothetical protein